MEIITLAQSRFTSKAYDASKKIPTEQLNTLLEILRLAPSSINIQPWQFLVAQSTEAKQLVSQSMPDNFAYNVPKILNASDVIIFTAKTNINDEHLENILSNEEQTGRFRTPESKQAQRNVRQSYVNLYKSQNILNSWVDNQIHIALGSVLLAARAEQIDATPMGGFDNQILDQVLNLADQGLRSVVVLALGYHSDEDFNASLPKARLSKENVIRIL